MHSDATLNFSPNDSMLAIYGVGYPLETTNGTFLWKIGHPRLCTLEVGDNFHLRNYHNEFVAFSPDSQYVLLDSCEGGQRSSNCYALWYTQVDRLVKRVFEARFEQQGDEIVLEYRDDPNAPKQTSALWWEVITQESPTVEPVIAEGVIHLIDRITGELLSTIEVKGQARGAEISHDGTLLALLITPPDGISTEYGVYLELWGTVAGLPTGSE